MVIQVSTDEINALIYSYLVDSGLSHAAYTLRNESHLDKTAFRDITLPRGELLTLLRKALLYSEVEVHWNKNSASRPCQAPFSLIKRHTCSTTPGEPSSLGLDITPRQELFPPIDVPGPTTNGVNATEKRKGTPQRDERAEKRARTEEPNAMNVDAEAVEVATPVNVTNSSSEPDSNNIRTPTDAINTGTAQTPDQDEEMEETTPDDGHHIRNGVIELQSFLGHPIYAAARNPAHPNVIATGAKSNDIQTWNLENLMQPDQHKFDPIPGLGDEAPDSSSLDWNSSGTLLAAASAGGTIHIWDADGHLRATLEEHTEDVMAARWSSTGRWLLSAGDRRALMYDSTDFDKPPRVFSQGEDEVDSCTDVEWFDEENFVTASGNWSVSWYHVDSETPRRKFSGHKAEVNMVRFSKDRKYLASGSDDKTAIVWSLGEQGEENIPGLMISGENGKIVLRGHEDFIECLTWGSTAGTVHILATSAKGELRLWDVRTGQRLYTLGGLKQQIMTHAFDPSGAFIAFAGGDGKILLHSISTGELLWDHVTGGVVCDISWQKEGRVMVATAGQNLHIAEFTESGSLVVR